LVSLAVKEYWALLVEVSGSSEKIPLGPDRAAIRIWRFCQFCVKLILSSFYWCSGHLAWFLLRIFIAVLSRGMVRPLH